ncbi:poly-gamma-glutamate synthase PgsB [Peribacillus cavernae]|uniref:poly-gamma-glutamate synthase PgsB n=1 Tax=Peribacillus cavernae TaxID=1674310 RepID=UPI001FE66A58|nr:poly-gamma-glutamate synthase PgsB [Peribacillus cavernae]MDQ0220187.1 poly-gamma-glutamate synthase PgsB/CapB [Peribacillus cavernae]
MWIIFVVSALIFLLGVLEKRRHQKNVDSIPVRVNINGIRGKSTVTRLITGILIEAGYKTVGKTTGTDARMIYWNTKEESPIVRRPEGPNIGEQRRVIKEVSDLEADALVSECMAVNPEYQIIFQEDMLQASIGVIVNVLEDHMDVMGPTLDDIAEAFLATIPHNGHVIVNESRYIEFFRKEAEKRNTKLIVADNSRISDEFLRSFEYMVFPDNASLALAVAEALDIDEITAFRGMLNAPPDPGAMKILPLISTSQPGYFVNGFAANDASSTINIWKRVEELGYPTDDAAIIMNCRPDRVDRTIQFANDVLPHIKVKDVFLIGETTQPIVRAYNEGKIPSENLHNLEGYTTDEIVDELESTLHGRVVYGVGNIHGAAGPLIERLETFKVKQLVS